MLFDLTLAALALLTSPQTGAKPTGSRSLLEVAPANVDVAVVVEDFAELWSRAKASAWVEVLRAPEFAPLWGPCRASFEEGWPLPDVSSIELLDGVHSILLCVDVSAEGGASESGALVVRLKPQTAGLRYRLREALARRCQRSAHEGRDLFGLEERKAIFEWRDGFALAGADTREGMLHWVTRLAQRLEQSSPQENLAARLGERRQTAQGAIEVYLDLRALTDQDESTFSEGERALWNGFALDDLGWLSLQAGLGEGVQSEVSMRLDLPSAGLLAGWAACARPAPIELARFAPATSIEVGVLGFDVPSAWRSLREMLSESYPDAADKLQGGLDAAKVALGADLESDLIELLTGDFAEILVPVEPAPEDPLSWVGFGVTPMMLALSGVPGSSQGSVVVVGLRETAPVQELIDAMVAAAGTGDWIEDEEVGGRWMTSLAPPDVPLRPSWAFLDGFLIASLQAEPVRAILRQAADDSPRSWLEAQRNREALGEFDPAFASSVADLQIWMQSQIAVPLASMSRMYAGAEGLGQHGSPDEEPKLAAAFVEIGKVLPTLIEKHLTGTIRSASWIEGGSLRYRAWTQ